MDTVQKLYKEKLIAIVRGVDPEKCRKLTSAIYDGGFRFIEFTFDAAHPELWSDTADLISAVRGEFDGRMEIGAGTVITPELAELACAAGASFAVAPDTNERVIGRCRELGLMSVSGAYTPSEILTAYNAGADFVKLFPVSEMGLGYIKAIRAPLNHVPLLAVGNVNPASLPGYLEAGCVGAAIGGCLTNREWIAAGRYDAITDTAALLCRIAHGEEKAI